MDLETNALQDSNKICVVEEDVIEDDRGGSSYGQCGICGGAAWAPEEKKIKQLKKLNKKR